MLRGNFHTHTTFCDGMNTAEEMAAQAAAIGFTHLGFSGHMDPDIRMDLGRYDAEIRRLQEALPGCAIVTDVDLSMPEPTPEYPGEEAGTPEPELIPVFPASTPSG